MTPMCKKCLDSYEMDHPAMQLFGEKCSCCGNPCVTVCMVSHEAIDKMNEEAATNEKT